MNTIIISLAVLGGIGCLAAIILYVVAQTFKVNEDPRIDRIEAVLPGANCGGCGKPGCRGFADSAFLITDCDDSSFHFLILL